MSDFSKKINLFFPTLFLILASCSVYKSQGRRGFETKADQNISSISLLSCTSAQSGTSKLTPQELSDKSSLILQDVNIFGLKLYKSTTAETNLWAVSDLQNNSCLYKESPSVAADAQQNFVKKFHELTDLSQASSLDQSLYY